MTDIIKALFISLILLSSCSDNGSQSVDQIVDIGSHSLHAVVLGSGSPTVVFDGGIATRSEEYRSLQDKIALATTVVTYDRAGYGSSDMGPLPRDSRREVEELQKLLAEMKVPRPYILVGHSLGGLNAQVFADLYPKEVAGMVLLDPTPMRFIMGEEYTELASMATQMTEEWQGIADNGLQSENEEERTNAEYFLMLASEHREMFNRSAKQASSIVSFGNIPLVVIASGVPNTMCGDVADTYQQFWAYESEMLATKSSRGEYVFVETSTHMLHSDAEDLVADRILLMVSSFKNSGQ